MSACCCWIVAMAASFAPAQEVPPAAPKKPHDGRSVEIYDIRDLLPSNRARRLFPPEIIDPRNTPVPPDELDAAAIAAGERATKVDEQCLPLFSAFVRCLGATDDKELTVETKSSGALVVKSFRETHDQIADALYAIRVERAAMVEVETRFLSLDASQRAELAKATGATGDGNAATDVFVPDVAAVERFVAAHPSVVLKGPKVVAAPLRPFEVSLAEQLSYVSGYESVAIEGLGTIADPVVKTVREGLVVEGMAITGAPEREGGEPFALRLSLRTTVVKRPIASAATDLGTIQLPETRHADVTSLLAGYSGSTAIVGGIPVPSFDEKDDGKRWYVLVTVRLVRPPR